MAKRAVKKAQAKSKSKPQYKPEQISDSPRDVIITDPLPRRRPGQPTLYREEYAEQARRLAKLAANDRDIAEFFHVDISTIWNWKVQHEKFFLALKEGKDELDHRVENSLFHRAVGYSYNAVKIFCHEGEITREEYVEHVPPDVTAQIFWLKNRQPEKWRDRHEIDPSKKDAPSFQFTLKIGNASERIEERRTLTIEAKSSEDEPA
jgi:hypothetical protein